MVYSEKEYWNLKIKYEQELQKLRKENEIKDKENKLLKKQNKEKDEVIHDLDRFNYRSQCESLKLENAELKKKLKIYEEKFELSRIKLEKDSSNSCKPSSTNGFKKVVQNNRVKSERKSGRPKGHPKSSPTVSETPDITVRVSKVATCTCGCKTVEKEEVARDLVTIKIIKQITQYVGMKTECPHCHKNYLPKFPKGLNHPVNYDENVKSILVYLNAYCNVANQKVVDFIEFLTHKGVKINKTTVINTVEQFSKKSTPTLIKMKKQIIEDPVIYEDETPIKVNGNIMSTIGVFTKDISYMQAFANRKLESFQEMGILDRYIGTVCHDHNKIHKSFSQSKDAECNFHILRYCKAAYEIHKWESIKEFMDYLLELRDTVEKYKLENRSSFTQEEYGNAKEKYLKKLDKWDKEHLEKADKDKPKYYDDERCLKTRLRENVDDHLRFLTDFRIDFTNNLAERGLRCLKKKIKISGTFRNLKFAKFYCNAMSIIETCIKKNMDIGTTICNIFRAKKKIFEF